MMKYKTNINGRKRTVYTGPKGGKYYMKGGKKLYVNRVMKGGARYYLEEGKTLTNGGTEISSFNDFLMYCKLKDYLQENSSRSLNLIQELRKITYTMKEEDAPKLFNEIEAICNIVFTKEFHAYRLIRFAKEVVIVCEEEEHNLVKHSTENTAGQNGTFSYSCSICGKEFNKDNYKNFVRRQEDNIQSQCTEHMYTIMKPQKRGSTLVSCEKCKRTINIRKQEYINYKKKITNSCEHSFSDGISQNHLLNENEPPITSYKCNKCNTHFSSTSNEYLDYKKVENALKLKQDNALRQKKDNALRQKKENTLRQKKENTLRHKLKMYMPQMMTATNMTTSSENIDTVKLTIYLNQLKTINPSLYNKIKTMEYDKVNRNLKNSFNRRLRVNDIKTLSNYSTYWAKCKQIIKNTIEENK
jgi:DNA-directed RNA polymerase subunit RPC12/RpoP